MKKILLMIFCTASVYGMSQNVDDAIRYSNVVPTGTAKFVSMAGATGALGADFSAMTINPAGVAIYRTGQMSISPEWTKAKVKSSYNGSSSNAVKNKFNLSNIGVVSVFPTGNETGCKAVNFSFAYNKTANLYRNALISGYNDNSSELDGEVSYFNNYFDESNIFYRADLFIYDSINNVYLNDYQNADLYGATQTKSIRSSGFIGEYAFALGANFNESFYFGGSINIIRINYEQTQKYSETPDEQNLLDMKDYSVTDYFQSLGTGLNMKLGLIYWLNENIRLGAAFHTPTIIDMSDDYSSRVESSVWYVNAEGSEYVQQKNAKSRGGIDWNLTMPGKFVGSAAFVFRNVGLLDVDCEVIDYSSASMESKEGEDDDFESVNNDISDVYHTTVNLRIGGELSLNALALRAGFGFYGSPYNNSEANSSANQQVYSLGLGWRGPNAYFDFGYNIATKKEKHYMYDDTSVLANLNSRQSNVVFTIGVKF